MHVDITPLREAAVAHGDFHDLAERLGYMSHGGRRVDGYRVKRDLGMVRYTSGDGPRIRKLMYEHKALRYCEALDLAPMDIGL